MSPRNLAKIDLVTAAFAKWKLAQDQAAKLDRQFAAEVALHGRGKGEFPAQLHAELKELRGQSDKLLLQAAHSLRTAAGGKRPMDPSSLDGSSAFGDLLN